MNRYERLLIELGEKNYNSVGSSWPVEVRIIMLALFNAVVFIIVKLLSNSLGPQVGSAIQSAVNSFLNRTPASTSTGAPSPPPAGLMGSAGGGFDFGSMIAGIGSLFTRNMGQSQTPSPGDQPPQRRGPRYAE